MHDRWIALPASLKGKSSVVKAQTVLYRQHDRNVVGIGRMPLVSVSRSEIDLSWSGFGGLVALEGSSFNGKLVSDKRRLY